MDLNLIRNEIQFSAVRSRGPGGQNVNKVSSAAILYWDFGQSSGVSESEKHLIGLKLSSFLNKEGQIYIRSDEFRDLGKNKSRCLEKLEDLLKLAFYKPKKRTATKPSFSSKVKKRNSKTKRSDIKKSRQKVWP